MIKGVHKFCVMTGYYRTPMPYYAQLSEPLVALTKKYQRFDWGVQQQESTAIEGRTCQ